MQWNITYFIPGLQIPSLNLQILLKIKKQHMPKQSTNNQHNCNSYEIREKQSSVKLTVDNWNENSSKGYNIKGDV